MPNFLEGATIKLTEPGDYYVSFLFEAAAGSSEAFITVKDSGKKDTPKLEAKEEGLKANPTPSEVLVDGQERDFDAYLIGGNNYFKLRDLAHIISGSEKQFEVNWDGEKEAINLISNEEYTSVGGEMAKGSGTEKKANLNTSKIYKDGQEVELSAYTIDGNNYFKLRDLGKAFNFGIGWDNDTKTITIDTSTEYTVE